MRVEDVTAELAAVIDQLCAADPAALADGGSIVALYRERERPRASRVRMMTLLQQKQNPAVDAVDPSSRGDTSTDDSEAGDESPHGDTSTGEADAGDESSGGDTSTTSLATKNSTRGGSGGACGRGGPKHDLRRR